MSNWVRVEDRKPDHMQTVLCIRSKNYKLHNAVKVCIFDNDAGFFVDENGWDFPAKYWMPLPEPPQELKEGKDEN